MDGQRCESKEEEVMGEGMNRWVENGGTGTRMRLSKRQRELIIEKRWSTTKGAISYFREDDEGGRARVTTDEEWVLRGSWTEMRLWRYGGWVIVRTLHVSVRSLYSMRSVILSQWRERRMWVMWHDVRALTTVRAIEVWMCCRRDNWDLGRL